MNNCSFTGNIGRDPDIKTIQTENGESFVVADFSLATQSFAKENGEFKKVAVWHTIKASGKLAENIGQYMKKGAHCDVTGELKYDTWKDKDTGKTVTKAYIKAEKVDWRNIDRASEAGAVKPEPTPESIKSEDIPF